MNASVEILYQKIIISFVIYIFIFSQEVPHTHFLILKLLSFILHLWKSLFFCLFVFPLKFCSSFIFFLKLSVLPPSHSQGGLTQTFFNAFTAVALPLLQHLQKTCCKGHLLIWNLYELVISLRIGILSYSILPVTCTIPRTFESVLNKFFLNE